MKSRSPLLIAYSKLLWLYPKPYRDRYAEPMTQALADMLEDQSSDAGRFRVWLRASLELPFSLTQQNILVMEEIMTSGTPNYVKRNSQIGALLVAPFFLIIIANSLTRHHALGDTPLLNDILRLAVIGLPAIAFLLCAGTFVKWALDRQTQEKVSFWLSLFDVRRNWPVLAVGSLGLMIVLFIFGHDSVHCITGNPLRELKSWSSTLQCLKQG